MLQNSAFITFFILMTRKRKDRSVSLYIDPRKRWFSCTVIIIFSEISKNVYVLSSDEIINPFPKGSSKQKKKECCTRLALRRFKREIRMPDLFTDVRHWVTLFSSDLSSHSCKWTSISHSSVLWYRFLRWSSLILSYVFLSLSAGCFVALSSLKS